MLANILKGVAVKTPILVSFQGTAGSGTDSTSYTFANFSIGSAFEGRVLVIGVTNPGTTVNTSTSSVTVAGINATQLNIAGGATSQAATVWAVTLDSGTTANIVVNFNVTATACGVAVWRLQNAEGYQVEARPNSLSSNITSSSGSYTFANVNKGDAIIVVTRARGASAGTYSYTGVTKEFDVLVETAVSSQSGGSVEIGSPQSSYAVGWSTSGSSPITGATYTRFYK